MQVNAVLLLTVVPTSPLQSLRFPMALGLCAEAGPGQQPTALALDFSREVQHHYLSLDAANIENWLKLMT